MSATRNSLSWTIYTALLPSTTRNALSAAVTSAVAFSYLTRSSAGSEACNIGRHGVPGPSKAGDLSQLRSSSQPSVAHRAASERLRAGGRVEGLAPLDCAV